MKCIACGSDTWQRLFTINEPDEYQKLIGDETRNKTWSLCKSCGTATNKPFIEGLSKIYEEYRSHELRKETVVQSFERILNIVDNENRIRIRNLVRYLPVELKSMLDIGSGLGVFPFIMKEYYKNIDCMEPNADSAEHLRDLGFKCYEGFFSKELLEGKQYELITLVHVLEHIENPLEFLDDVHDSLLQDGLLYIEVPDASELLYLPHEHDEFSVCHLYFYNHFSLRYLLTRCGFKLLKTDILYYDDRNLTRLACLFQKGE